MGVGFRGGAGGGRGREGGIAHQHCVSCLLYARRLTFSLKNRLRSPSFLMAT